MQYAVSQLVEHNKHFVVLGNVNAVTYKEIFSLFQQNKLWLGPQSSERLT